MLQDIDGKMMVIEMIGSGQNITTLEEFASRYRDIVVARPNEYGSEAGEWMLNRYFREKTPGNYIPDPDNHVSYNYHGLFGLFSTPRNDENKSSFICSEWYYFGIRMSAGIEDDIWDYQMPGITEDNQISPFDLTISLPSWGTEIIDLYND